MKISDIPFPPYLATRVRPVDRSASLMEGLVKIRGESVRGEFGLFSQNHYIEVTPVHRGDVDKLSYAATCGRGTLCWLRDVAKDGSGELLVYLFNGDIEEMDLIEVGIDEPALESARKAFGGRNSDMEAVNRLLAEACVFEGGLNQPPSSAYFFFTAGPAADEVFEARPDSERKKSRNPEPTAAANRDPAKGGSAEGMGAEEFEPVPPQRRSFCIHGANGLRLAVSRKMKSQGEEIFLASRITRSRAGRSDNAMRLARAVLTFTDYTKAGHIRGMVAMRMATLLTDSNSYLKKWDEYGDMEGKVLLDHARAVGALKITKSEPYGNGVALFFNRPVPEDLQVGDEIELVQELPIYLKNNELEWQEFCRILQEEASGTKKDRTKRTQSTKIKRISGKMAQVDLRQIPDSEINFFAIVSMSSERIQIERRMDARKQVVHARSANPQLGLLIEEDGDIPEVARSPKIDALTHFVLSKVFPKNPPTAMQQEAIRVALNTPDIALIQGPPGTGKTTVIAAILERLNEMSDKRASARGQVLLTGFQHDAVENVIQRISLNSLPVPKFGRKDEMNLHADRVSVWCEELAARLKASNSDLKPSLVERSLVLSCHQYVLAPTTELALHIVSEAQSLPRSVIGPDLGEQLRTLQQVLLADLTAPVSTTDTAIDSVCALRVNEVGFRDDGPERAADLAAALPDYLSPDDHALLKQAILWRTEEPTPWLGQLRVLKRRLLEELTPRPVFRSLKPRQDVLDVLGAVMKEVRERGLGTKDKTSTILSEFLAVLEGDPYTVQKTVADYSYAFAATCQQSARGEMMEARLGRRRNRGDDLPSFDTVIVDEAARVGPRDLLIPMVQGRRRIILVGDHRQLPHLIDEEVVRALESGKEDAGEVGGKSENELIEQSMFQYLFRRLAALEKQDNIRRRVTLDQQFRMHPLLGQFVSDNFYASFGEPFGSPLSDSLFPHSLPGANGKAAMWVNLPIEEGPAIKREQETSWIRLAEIERVAGLLKEWMTSPEGAELSFGVISFYKAQTESIKADLAKDGFTIEGEDGSWEIAPEYAHLPAKDGKLPEERLRIGTVDAFQGMEFDVVILSMVRSHRMPDKAPKSEEIERTGRRLFGHLMSVNRLCVSMSRQKRLLVVVGDAGMISGPIGRQCVPGLANFYQLCQEKGVVK